MCGFTSNKDWIDGGSSNKASGNKCSNSSASVRRIVVDMGCASMTTDFDSSTEMLLQPLTGSLGGLLRGCGGHCLSFDAGNLYGELV